MLACNHSKDLPRNIPSFAVRMRNSSFLKKAGATYDYSRVLPKKQQPFGSDPTEPTTGTALIHYTIIMIRNPPK